MSQDWNIPVASTASLPTQREAVNDALLTLLSNNSGGTEPSAPTAGQFWYDTASSVIKVRNAANDGWIPVVSVVGTAPGPAVVDLDGSGFNGVATSFVGLLPVEPNLTSPNDVALTMSGIGILKRVAGSPSGAQYALSGATNQDVTFGYAPAAGDFGNAVFIAA